MCAPVGEVAHKGVQLRNETVCRKFRPDIPIMFLPGAQARIQSILMQQARMMRVVSPERFVTHGIIMWNKLHLVNTDGAFSVSFISCTCFLEMLKTTN